MRILCVRAVMVLLTLCIAFQMQVGVAAAQTERKADIVFVIDTTGSMGGVINNVKNNISQFVDILNSNHISARLGLVTYKDIYADGYNSTSNFGWFGDSAGFKNTLSGISAYGGGDSPESAVDGLEEARRMGFQSLAKKFIILVTDVDYKEGTRFDTPSDPITMSEEIAMLKADNIVVSAVAPSGYQWTYQSLYSTTGGIFSDISTAFSSNLNALASMINTNAIPSLTVLSPQANQLFGKVGVDLTPKISVSDPDGDTLICKYYVDAESSPRDTRTITNTATAQQVIFNALPLAGLTDGDHTLRLEISDQWAEPVAATILFRIDQTPPTIGSVSASSTDTAITVTGTATDGGSGLAALPFRYTIGSKVSAWTASPFTATGLTPNTLFNVKVEAKDQLDHIATKQQSVYTIAQVPAPVISNSTETTFRISLNDSNPSATAYQIKVGAKFVSATGSLTSTPTSVTPTGKQMTVAGLTSNTTYSVQALAINQEGTATAWSAAVSGTTTVAPPATLTTSQTQTSIAVNWTASSGATGYDIEVDGVVRSNGTMVSYTHSGLSPETRHTYRVRAVNGGGTGSWSPETIVYTWPNPPGIPQNLTAAATDQTEVTLNWDSAAKADSYELEADGTVIGLGNRLTYKHAGLAPDTGHEYRIRARNIGGVSAWSALVNQSTLPYPPEAPGDVNAVLSIHSVTLAWSEAERAASYEIEADGVILDNGASTTYVHEGLESLSGHTYRVRAVNAGGKSSWSAPLDVTTHPDKPTVPSNLIAISDETTVTVTWYNVPHAEFYEIEADGQTVVLSGEDAQFVHTGLPADSLHTYRVRAKNISGYSDWSALVKMATLPVGEAGSQDEALTNVAAIVTNTFITLSWDTVAPEAEYEVEVDGVVQGNGNNTIFNHTGLAANGFHTYKVRVVNDGQPGRWVAVLSLSTLPNPPDAPKDISAAATEHSIELRWDRVEGATGYEIEIDGKTFIVGADSAYLHDNLQPGTSYTYRVRASNVTGVTAWSPALHKSTTTPLYNVSAKVGMTFDLTLFAHNVQDFGEKTFVVTYDPNALEIVDLDTFTLARETNANGVIPGTPLEVHATQGRFAYKVNRNVVPGTSWSGEITTIEFKAKKDGQTNVNVTME